MLLLRRPQVFRRGVVAALCAISVSLLAPAPLGAERQPTRSGPALASGMSPQYLGGSAQTLSASYAVTGATLDAVEVYAWAEIPAASRGARDDASAGAVLVRLGNAWKAAPPARPGGSNGVRGKTVSTMVSTTGNQLRLSIDMLDPSTTSRRYLVAVMWKSGGCGTGTLADVSSDLFRALGPFASGAKWTQALSGRRKLMMTDAAKRTMADALIRALKGREDGRWESPHALNCSGYAPKLIDALDIDGKRVWFNLAVRDDTATSETWVSLATPVLLEDD